MNAKIKKINAEYEKNAAKIAELQARQKELDKQRTELENLDIVGIFDGAVLRDVTVMVVVHAHAGDNRQGHIFQEPQLQGAGSHHDLHCDLIGFLIQQGGLLAEQVLSPVVSPAVGSARCWRPRL